MASAMGDERENDVYAELRPLLFAIAYRMLGSVGEAEDVVQEAFLRYHRARAQGTVVEAPKAYLSAVATRLAIDQLKSARVRRETYVGPWLPEPIVTDPREDPSAHAELADALSLAFLVLLERLSPLERAAFLLREALDFPYAEIARVLERSEAACRQLVTRARRRLGDERGRYAVPRERHAQLTARFVQAVAEGDTRALVGMLAEDAIAYSDGGGRTRAARKPIYGADRVTRLLVGISRPERAPGPLLPLFVDANGAPALALVEPRGGRPFAVLSLDVGPDERVRNVWLVVNPDKLAHVALAAPEQLP
jgi:RNA polymerase sigma-70 factor (ECF subfamily)